MIANIFGILNNFKEDIWNLHYYLKKQNMDIPGSIVGIIMVFTYRKNWV